VVALARIFATRPSRKAFSQSHTLSTEYLLLLVGNNSTLSNNPSIAVSEPENMRYDTREILPQGLCQHTDSLQFTPSTKHVCREQRPKQQQQAQESERR
jgi:hypothetical protein